MLSSIILGWSYTHKKDGNEAVTVTGSAKKRIKSDLVIWSAGVSYQSAQLSDAYKQLSENIPRIKKYLIEKGIAENQITVSAISSNTLHGRDENGNENSEITGYNLRQEIVVNLRMSNASRSLRVKRPNSSIRESCSNRVRRNITTRNSAT